MSRQPKLDDDILERVYEVIRKSLCFDVLDFVRPAYEGLQMSPLYHIVLSVKFYLFSLYVITSCVLLSSIRDFKPLPFLLMVKKRCYYYF